MWKLKQVQAELPSCGAHPTNVDLTEFLNLECLCYDYYNNGSLDANIDARYSRYMKECKYGNQLCKEWFENVKYWSENNCMPSDEEQDWYATRWIESMLMSIDFDYDESKAKEAKEAKEAKAKKAKKREREPDKFAVSASEFAEYCAFQKRGKGLPRWFHSDDKKASEIMNKYAQLSAHYN